MQGEGRGEGERTGRKQGERSSEKMGGEGRNGQNLLFSSCSPSPSSSQPRTILLRFLIILRFIFRKLNPTLCQIYEERVTLQSCQIKKNPNRLPDKNKQITHETYTHIPNQRSTRPQNNLHKSVSILNRTTRQFCFSPR